MLLKKFNSLALLFGLIGSLECQGVSGAGKVSRVKDNYIYISGNEKRCKRSDEKANALLSTVKKKLEKTKDFIYENSGVVASTATLGLLTPAAVYAGCKLGQRYFNKNCETPTTDVKLEHPVKDKMDTEVPVDPANSKENIENGEKTRAGNHALTKDNTTSANSSEGKNSNQSSANNAKGENGAKEIAKDINSTANNGEVLNSSKNVNTLGADENLNKKSVFLGVYSEPIIYLLLKLTPQNWGCQKWWYDFWHYENGRFSEPFKLILAGILWVEFLLDILLFIGTVRSYIYYWIRRSLHINAHIKVAKTFLNLFCPTASRLMGIFCESLFIPISGKKIAINRKDRLVGAILGYYAFNWSVQSHNKGNILLSNAFQKSL